jgi:hypothetical protein
MWFCLQDILASSPDGILYLHDLAKVSQLQQQQQLQQLQRKQQHAVL